MRTTIKVSWPQPKDSAFIAFPWNVHLISTYETIFRSLQAQDEYSNLTFIYGSKVLSSDVSSQGVAEYINRNKQMYEIFVEGIEESDIFIADITGQNSNVMLELGIAMKLNKNILILKEKDKEETYPFDIQSIKIQEYASVSELQTIIAEFIDMHSKIRNQTFDSPLPELYTKVDDLELNGTEHKPLYTKPTRNLKIRFKYEFVDYVNSMDWIGIHLRTQGPDRENSELIYSRVGGQLESLPWPTTQPPIKADHLDPGGEHFEVSLIENKLEAKNHNGQQITANILADGFGDILIMTQAHSHEQGREKNALKVNISDIEIIQLDTTSPT